MENETYCTYIRDFFFNLYRNMYTTRRGMSLFRFVFCTVRMACFMVRRKSFFFFLVRTPSHIQKVHNSIGTILRATYCYSLELRIPVLHRWIGRSLVRLSPCPYLILSYLIVRWPCQCGLIALLMRRNLLNKYNLLPVRDPSPTKP